jgi:hypothetical protein
MTSTSNNQNDILMMEQYLLNHKQFPDGIFLSRKAGQEIQNTVRSISVQLFLAKFSWYRYYCSREMISNSNNNLSSIFCIRVQQQFIF